MSTQLHLSSATKGARVPAFYYAWRFI